MEVKVNAYYRHFKGFKIKVLCVAHHTEKDETLVVYEELGDHKIWARPIEMFTSKVDHEKYPDVKQEYRFELEHD